MNSVIDWVRIYDNDKYQYQLMICSQAVNLQLVGVRNNEIDRAIYQERSCAMHILAAGDLIRVIVLLCIASAYPH